MTQSGRDKILAVTHPARRPARRDKNDYTLQQNPSLVYEGAPLRPKKGENP